MTRNILIVSIALMLLLPLRLFSQATITIDASAQPQPISKYLYGRNNSLSDNPASPLKAADWTRLRDAGVMFLRESGGNNCTKYNWKLKISSHPDWYNNVYPHDWDFAAQSLQQNLPHAQGMWAFQLLGKAAKTSASNFPDNSWNGSTWWQGVNQNLAGGGIPNPSTWTSVTDPNTASTKAATEGNADLYLENWTADSTTNILDHWYNTLGLDKNNIRYWNMDNEIEIWSGTHDDVMPTQISPEDFLTLYFAVAKKARALYPDIKIVGPVTANEWQWYNWNNNAISGGDGKYYPWLQYFIKRVAEEEKSSGVRLLDVLDIHFYPGSKKNEEVVQMHRIYFDKNYVFPEANGVKNISGAYDNSQTKEYILARCEDWLTNYMGSGHGVTLGVTETGVQITDPNALAVWYAGTIGEFTQHPEMEIFTPWSWNVGMWETLHLFSRYNKLSSIPATSTNESMVSAYPTVNATGDSITVMLVNRSTASPQSVTVNFKNFILANESFTSLRLSGLPSTETFVSHTNNALQKSFVTVSGNSISISMPALSIVGIQVRGQKGEYVAATEKELDTYVLQVFPVPPTDSKIQVVVNKPGNAIIDIIDPSGKTVKGIYNGVIADVPFKREVDFSPQSKGVYFIRLQLNGTIITRKISTN